MVKRVKFMGWVAELPKIDSGEKPLDDYDLLRMVILAEDGGSDRWVVFKCEDSDHAFKVRRAIIGEGFKVEIRMRRNMLYIRSV